MANHFIIWFTTICRRYADYRNYAGFQLAFFVFICYSSASQTDSTTYYHSLAIASTQKAQTAGHVNHDMIMAEKFGKEALTYFTKSKDHNGLDTVYRELYSVLYTEGRFDEATDYCEKYYTLAKEKKDVNGIFRSLQGMLAVNRQQGNYAKSFFYAQKLYDIARKSGKEIWMAESLWGLGKLYSLIDNQPQALQYYRQSRSISNHEIRQEWMREHKQEYFDLEFAEVFSRMKLFDSAWYYYKRIIPLEQEDQTAWLVSTGECYFLQGNFQQSLYNFQKGLGEYKFRNDVNETMRTGLDIARSSLALDKFPVALAYAQAGLQTGLQTKMNPSICESYRILAETYARMNQPDSSNTYFRNYITYKDAMLNDQAKGRFATYQQEQQISMVNAEKQWQYVQLQKEILWRYILTGGIALILLLAIVLLRNISLKRNIEERQRLLAENALQIQKLEAGKLQMELQREKSELEIKALRTQMNPHFIFNCLNSINGYIIRHRAEEASDYLTKFAKLIRMVLENSQKDFIHLEDELEGLKWYMDLENIRFEKPFTYTIDIHGFDVNSLKVPPLLLQPFVENAIWHGLHPKLDGQGKICISLSLDHEELYYQITDNGMGRAKAESHKKYANGFKKSMGIDLTRQRIGKANNLHDNGMGIEIEDVLDDYGNIAGTRVRFKTPSKSL